MASELLLSRSGRSLIPVEPVSADLIEAMANGEMVTATIRRTRNPGHHRKFWALVKVVYDAQDRYATQEQLVNVLKMAVGCGDIVKCVKGKPMFIPGSISFAKMDQAAFEQFYNRVVDVILTRILPGVESDELEKQVLDLMGE